MAVSVNTRDGSFDSIKINGCSINDPRWEGYIDGDGVFRWSGVTIKPSGSVRIGTVKVHPSGLIQVGTDVEIEGSILPSKATAGKPITGRKTSGTAGNKVVREIDCRR